MESRDIYNNPKLQMFPLLFTDRLIFPFWLLLTSIKAENTNLRTLVLD